MPTLLKIKGYRFFFFSLEGNEPPHIHVEYGDSVAKFWLNPIKLANSYGFRSHELAKIRIIIVHDNYFRRNGMNSLAIKFDDRAIDVSFTQTALHFVLADGREVSAPLE